MISSSYVIQSWHKQIWMQNSSRLTLPYVILMTSIKDFKSKYDLSTELNALNLVFKLLKTLIKWKN